MKAENTLLKRCVDAIEFLVANPRWQRLTDIAEGLSLQKGQAHRLLNDLSALGWIEQDMPSGRYRLTLRLAMLGQQYLRGTGLSGLVQPILDEAARTCREFMVLAIVQGNSLHWLTSAQGAPAGLMLQPEIHGRLVLYATANGKAWLSTMNDEDAVRLALADGLGQPNYGGAQVGPKALHTVQELLRELALGRERGYSIADDEGELGVRSIAVAIRAFEDQRVFGTMSIAGPQVRMNVSRDAELSALLHATAKKLGMVWPRYESRPQDTPPST